MYISESVEDMMNSYIKRMITASTLDKPIWNIEGILHKRPPAWNYIDGLFISGLLSLYSLTQDLKLYDFALRFVDYYIDDEGVILGYNPLEYNIDNISFGRVLFDLYASTGLGKYKNAIDLIYTQINTQPRTEKGSFWHKSIYPNQVWLDGLYMGQVFYTRYETQFNNCRNYDDILLQFENVRRYMFNEQKGLHYHGCDFSKKIFWADRQTGLSKSFWLRAIGWHLAALIDVLDYTLDKSSKLYSRLSLLFREAVSGVLYYIDDATKMFYQVIDQGGREGNYIETSGSAMIAYATLKAARLGIIEKGLSNIGKQIFKGICGRCLTEREDGIHLTGTCLSAGLGPENNMRRDGSYEYYISEPIVDDDAKGLGIFMMLYAEMKRVNFAEPLRKV